jgi:protein-tyrosine phosphatase
VGEPPDPRALKHATQRGYDLSKQRARLLSSGDFREFDYILAMDRSHLRQLRALAPKDGHAKVGLFLEMSGAWKGEDVPDPYYGGPDGFEHVLDMVEEAAEKWLDVIAADIDPAAFRLR